MKICWDKIENIVLTVNGKFRTGYNQNTFRYYEEKESCENCGESYLMPTKRPSKFCSTACGQSGKFHYLFGKKLSDEQKKLIGKHSKERNQGDKHPSWKGGVTALNLPRYDTYSDRISYCESTRRDPNNMEILQVKCYKCNEWYTPTRRAVGNRIEALKTYGRENHLYCSETCKNSCTVFNRPSNPANEKQGNTYNDLRTWRMEVLKRAQHICEYCGNSAEVAHHIQPMKLSPFLALDPDNGIACCNQCHYKYGHRDECSTGNLSSIVCT